VFYTKNHGKTWKQGGQVPEYADENQVIELADGSLLMNARITRDVPEKHRRKISVSQDKGRTWSEPFMDQALISPCCQASLLRYSFEEGKVKSRILFSHPGSDTARVNMTIRLSTDEAKTWPVAKAVNEGPAAYSCLTVMPDGTIGVLYETGEKEAYEKIAFARFNLEWLTEGKDDGDQ
jgi:hypothetical protein